MGFFKLSDGSNVGGEKEYDSSEGYGQPLPDKTDVLADLERIEWRDGERGRTISTQWKVLAPAAYKDRKLFHKFKVNDDDSKKRDKAVRMLAAIDACHGGKLNELEGEPTDAQLARALVGKLMSLKVGLWEIDDKSGNYIMAVAPRKGGETVKDEPKAKAATKKKPAFDADDDIPF